MNWRILWGFLDKVQVFKTYSSMTTLHVNTVSLLGLFIDLEFEFGKKIDSGMICRLYMLILTHLQN